jgi:hypothetical protein
MGSFEHERNGGSVVMCQMATTAEPRDLYGLVVIGMVHLRLGISADLARLSYDLSSSQVCVGVGAGVHLLPLFWRKLVGPAKFPHLLGVV